MTETNKQIELTYSNTKEIFSNINNTFKLGELGEENNKNRANICRLTDKSNLKKACDPIIDNMLNPLEKIIDNKEIIETYKTLLKNLLSQENYVVNIIKILPRDLFSYFLSIIGLKIYFDKKNTLKKENINLINYFNNSDFFNKEEIVDCFCPFDIFNKKNSFNGYLDSLLKHKNLKNFNYDNISKWRKNNGQTISSKGLLSFKESLECEDDIFDKKKIEKIIVILFFKRIQWKIYEKWKEDLDDESIRFFENLPIKFIKILKKDNSTTYDFSSLVSDPNLQKIIKKMAIKPIKNNYDKLPKLSKDLFQFLKNKENLKKNLKTNNLINSSKEEEYVFTQLNKYNDLKDKYSLVEHKNLKKELFNQQKLFSKSKEKWFEKFLNYFIEDSYYLLDTKITSSEKQKEKNELISLKNTFKKEAGNRCILNKKYTGEKIDYLDLIFSFLTKKKFDISIFVKLFKNTTDEYKEELKTKILTITEIIYPDIRKSIK